MKRLDIMTTVEVATKLDQSPDLKPPYPIWVEPGLLVGSFVCYCFAIEYTAFLIPMVLLFFLYLPLAIHGLLHRFTLDRINGVNISVVSVFLLSLALTILAQGDFDSLETEGLVLIGLPFLIPIVIVPVVSSRMGSFPDSKFLQGLLLAVPLGAPASAISVGMIATLASGESPYALF